MADAAAIAKDRGGSLPDPAAAHGMVRVLDGDTAQTVGYRRQTCGKVIHHYDLCGDSVRRLENRCRRQALLGSDDASWLDPRPRCAPNRGRVARRTDKER